MHPTGLRDSEMWLLHTEDPSQGHRQHHSLHHYFLIFKAGQAQGFTWGTGAAHAEEGG